MRWTSRNKNIDYRIKTLQLRTRRYKEVIEWILFDGLSNVEKIGKGGICPLYSAILSDYI